MEVDKTKWPFYLMVLLEQTKVTQALKSYSKETFNSANGQFFPRGFAPKQKVLTQNYEQLSHRTNIFQMSSIFGSINYIFRFGTV